MCAKTSAPVKIPTIVSSTDCELFKNLSQSVDRPPGVLNGILAEFHPVFPFDLLCRWDFGKVEAFAKSHGLIEMRRISSIVFLFISFSSVGIALFHSVGTHREVVLSGILWSRLL